MQLYDLLNFKEENAMKNQIKILVDIAMTVVLIFLMSYELIGQTNHEILGIVMTVLFFVHHYLNRKWLGKIGHGRYDAYRKFQTALVILLSLCIVCQAVSGIILRLLIRSIISILDSLSLKISSSVPSSSLQK